MRWWQIRKRNADLERDLRSDLDLEEEEQRERGLSTDEARYAARRSFGNATLIKQQTYEVWGWARVECFFQDLRFAFRQFQKSPGFAAAVVCTLAQGAQPRDILSTVLSEGLVIAGIGVLSGLEIGLFSEKVVQRFVAEVHSLGALTVVASAGLILAAAMLASAVPTVLAARVKAVEALRAQ